MSGYFVGKILPEVKPAFNLSYQSKNPSKKLFLKSVEYWFNLRKDFTYIYKMIDIVHMNLKFIFIIQYTYTVIVSL